MIAGYDFGISRIDFVGTLTQSEALRLIFLSIPGRLVKIHLYSEWKNWHHLCRWGSLFRQVCRKLNKDR